MRHVSHSLLCLVSKSRSHRKEAKMYQLLSLGSSVSTRNEGSIVSFAIYENTDPVFERSNARHDFYQKHLKRNAVQLSHYSGSRGRPALLKSHKNLVKGATGPCILRSLSHFDVGQSFMFDSLHNLYLGLFISTRSQSY